MEKDKSIEYIRVIACSGVILIHVLKSAHDVFTGLSTSQMFLCTAMINNLRWCVPVFLMISGYLLLDPARPMTVRKICNYIERIAVVLFFFGTAFSMLELMFDAKQISFGMLPIAVINVLKGDTWSHLWYLYILIVLYAFLPFLRGVVDWRDKQMFFFSCWVLFIFSSILPLFKSIGLSSGFSGGFSSVYMLYMLLGYSIKNREIHLKKWLCGCSIGVSSIFLVFLAFLQEYRFITIQDVWINHSSIFVVVQSVSVFCLLSEIKETKVPWIDKWMICIAENSFGIYIMHMVYINLIYKLFKISPVRYGSVIYIPVCLATSILTLLSVILMRKIKIVRKYI